MILKNNCEARMWWLATVCILAIIGEAGSASFYGSKPSGFLQVIRRLGVNRSGAALQVSQGRSQSGESPIYFIKLPPTPYFYLQNAVSALGDPDHKVPVDFTNNGRPNQVYHWNLPELNSHLAQPPFSTAFAQPAAVPGLLHVAAPSSVALPSPAGVPGLINVESPVLLPGGPSLAPVTRSASPVQLHAVSVPSSPEDITRVAISPSTAQPSGSSAKKTWISGKKQYAYNGRPSGIYIYKSKRPIRPIAVPKNGRRPTRKASQRK
ncbi:uncharacterized protein LOC135224193 [Macrobrachium nipponense]|uniref:uncharacterized protein LOC135224193 n=1 Tax=Macrobrachium nipponense TaxID=159736 RepID=UPI0030C7AD76